MRGVVLFAAVLALASSAAGKLEFSGFIRTGGELRVVLTDLETGQSSGFLAVGESFREHKVVGLAQDILTVEHDGKRYELSLKIDGVKDGAAPAAVEKTTVAIGITSEGKAMLEGRPVSFDELDATLKRLAEKGAPLHLAIHEPLNPNQTSHQGTKRVMESIKQSGAKKWSIQIVDASDAKRSER